MTSTQQSLPDFARKGLIEILGDAAWEELCRGQGGGGTPGEEGIGLSQVLTTLRGEYGENTGLGLAQRAGGAAFKYFQTQFSEQLKLTSLEMRTRPLHARLREGLKSMAACLNREFGMDVTFEERGGEWFLTANACPECAGSKSPGPICYFAVGLIQEFLGWSAGSKFYPVEETTCTARGDASCEFHISREPID
jgi:predicted hydrocarbon binding protein